MSLSWSVPFGTPPTTYIVEAGNGPGLANLARISTNSTTPTVTFTGVPRGSYYVRITAANQYGVGAASEEIVVNVPGSNLLY